MKHINDICTINVCVRACVREFKQRKCVYITACSHLNIELESEFKSDLLSNATNV